MKLLHRSQPKFAQRWRRSAHKVRRSKSKVKVTGLLYQVQTVQGGPPGLGLRVHINALVTSLDWLTSPVINQWRLIFHDVNGGRKSPKTRKPTSWTVITAATQWYRRTTRVKTEMLQLASVWVSRSINKLPSPFRCSVTVSFCTVAPAW